MGSVVRGVARFGVYCDGSKNEGGAASVARRAAPVRGSVALVLGALLTLAGCSAGGSTSHSNGSGGAPGGVSGGSSSTSGGNTALGAGGSTGGAQGGASSGPGGGAPSGSGGALSSGGSTTTGGAEIAGSPAAAGNANAGAGGVAACQTANYTFQPKVPTVFVMVDRSGSMFDCISTSGPEASCPTPEDTSWVKLKSAALTVIKTLQSQVRFGFASFTGTNPQNGGTCPMIDQVAPDIDNYQKIAELYDSLAFQPNTTESGKKFETPARQALDLIGGKLIADSSPGDKYILFVTDGEPDYCDDSNALCPPDSVIAGLQALKAQGVTTIVMGLQSAQSNLPAGILQAFANAGAGENTVAPLRANSDNFSFYDECNSIAGWHADLVASGKPAERGVTLGTYSSAAGPTKPYAPSVAEQASIVTQLGKALSGVKSCTFDLSNVNGQSIKVDLNKLSEAAVKIEGQTIPLDANSGWSMASASQLSLNGAACETWRNPDVSDIQFNFPCKTIIFE